MMLLRNDVKQIGYYNKRGITMDKEKRKILNTMIKFFEEKGYKKEEIAEIEELAGEKGKKRKRKLHSFEKITDLKDMLAKTEKRFGDKPAFKYKTAEFFPYYLCMSEKSGIFACIIVNIPKIANYRI